MSPTSRLYDALSQFLRQREIQWRDVRHLQTLCWMMIGMIQSQNVHLNGFGVMLSVVLKLPSPISGAFVDGCRTDALMSFLPIML